MNGMGKLESQFMEDTVIAAMLRDTTRPSLGCLLMYCLLILFHSLLYSHLSTDHQNESHES
jgi:hypothetical protein